MREFEEPKGCRVTVTVEEPGFSDARIALKYPWGNGDRPERTVIRAGESHTFVLKSHLKNSVTLTALLRDGDPECPDGHD